MFERKENRMSRAQCQVMKGEDLRWIGGENEENLRSKMKGAVVDKMINN